MKNWLLILVLAWLLAGCVFERYTLPDDYRPAHKTATAPLADGAIFRGKLDAQKGGEITLRFVKTGAARYVVEHLVVMPDGEEPALPPAHVHLLPLGGAHYALHWKRLADTKQGYALVRLDAGQFQLLEPLSQSSTLALASAHSIVAKPPGLGGGYSLEASDEARVLKFFKDLATRKSEARLTLVATEQAPTALRARTLTQLGAHIPRLTRGQLGTVGDEEALVTWARSLAGEGNGYGHYLLARLTANGWGTPADGPAAIRAAEAAATKGVPQAAAVTAAVYYFGVGVPADPLRALPYARRAADVGVPAAMYLLGVAYRDGQGVAGDEAEARRWVRAAADAGHPDAHPTWAELMLDDQTAASDAQAIAALEAGMEAGVAHAFYLRGFMYENGRGGAQDFAAATAMFLEAAKRRHDYATYLAGERLRRGQGIPQDIIRGRKLLARAVEKGIKEAETALERTDKVLPGNTCVKGMCGNSQADAKPNPNLDNPPYIFAGLRYGASYQDAIRLFGKPERIDSSGASTELFWSNDKFGVSYRKDTGFINSFTIVGQEGVAIVRSRAPKEGMLKLLDLPKAKVSEVMGKPTNIWYHDTRMDWQYAIDSHRQGSIFLECSRGPEQICDQMKVHWSGKTTWDPNDGVDSWGLRMSPICGNATFYRDMKAKRGFVLSSEKAQTPVWELELFTNAAKRTWALAGKYRDKSVWTATPSSWDLCELSQGDGDYRTQKWYEVYFGEQQGAHQRNHLSSDTKN